MRRDDQVIREYAALLASLGDEAQAEILLRKVLRNHWSDELINLYGRLEGTKPEEQLILAEQWLKDRPNNPELLLALGRISLRNELWGKAREYFETSLRLRRSRETLAELSRLNAHMGEKDTSIKLLMQGLVQDSGLPDLPMPKA
jgi:HemY protein